MKYFVHAHDKDGHQMLGTEDGQTSFPNGNYKRTNAYKELKAGNRADGSLISLRAKEWRIVSEEGKTVGKINNPWFRGSKNE